MRVSSNQFHMQSFSAIEKHQNSVLDIQEKLTTGNRVNRPSDDPVATSQIHSLNKAVNTISQFEKNGDFAKSQLSLEETQISTAVDLTQRARELSIQMMNGTYTADDRQATAQEIDQIIKHLTGIMNSNNSEGELLFAGNNVDATAAFVTDPANSGALQPGNEYYAYIGSANAGAQFDDRANFGSRFVQIGFDNDQTAAPDDKGDSSRVRITDNGAKVFNVPGGATSLPPGVDPSLLNVLVGLKDSLDQGNPPPDAVADDLLSAVKGLSKQQAEIGSRQNRIQTQFEAGQTFSMALQERRVSIEEMDVVEGISQLNMRQNALQMAQQVFSKVQGMSLFDYLR